MTAPFQRAGILCSLTFLLVGPNALAQENVTVPKARLEELERKEKELDRLKGDLKKTTDENVQLKQQTEKVAARPVQAQAPEPAVNYVSPPLDSLPALRPDDVVESMDLANYYRSDRGAADRRFRKQKVSVRGEIVGFEKPLWKSNYRVLLKTPGRDVRVICDFLPPENSSAVFTTDHGDQLVALIGDGRVPLARLGQTVIARGECKGLSGDSVVMILGRDLKVVR